MRIQIYFENLSKAFKKYEKILGKLVLVCGVTMATAGLASQVYRNYVEQQCGISIILTLLALVLYGLRIPYSIIKKAWHLIPADFCGVVACIILTIQWFLY